MISLEDPKSELSLWMIGRVRLMLNDDGFKEEIRRGIWAECASTVTFYANILVNHESGKPNHE
jgi:hypothetical protein